MQREPNTQPSIYFEIVIFIMNESDSLTIKIIDPLILKLGFHSDLYQLAAKKFCRANYIVFVLCTTNGHPGFSAKYETER